MRCKICGTPLVPGAVLCKNCGASNTNLEQKDHAIEVLTFHDQASLSGGIEQKVDINEFSTHSETVESEKKEKEFSRKTGSGEFLVLFSVIVALLSATVIGYLIYSSLTIKNEENRGTDVVVVKQKNYYVSYAGYKFNLTTEYEAYLGKYLEISKDTWVAKIAYSENLEFSKITNDNLKKTFEIITDYKIGDITNKTYGNIPCFETTIDYVDGVKSLLLVCKRDIGYWYIEIGVSPYENYPTTEIAKNVVVLLDNAKKEEIDESKLRIEDLSISVEENTYNKSAIFFGDSITYGYYSTPIGYGWANYIGENYSMTTVNAGKSGWLVSNYFHKNWINSVIKSHSKKQYDYVILHGGTNDIRYKVPLGSYNIDDFSGIYNTETVIGGIETMIYTAKSLWPNAKIGFIINYQMPRVSTTRVKLANSYYSEIKKVFQKWNIKYLDLYFGNASNGQTFNDFLQVNTSTYLVDSVHLNLAGYKIISPEIYKWMNEL